jgi:hypothetical protein
VYINDVRNKIITRLFIIIIRNFCQASNRYEYRGDGDLMQFSIEYNPLKGTELHFTYERIEKVREMSS